LLQCRARTLRLLSPRAQLQKATQTAACASAVRRQSERQHSRGDQAMRCAPAPRRRVPHSHPSLWRHFATAPLRSRTVRPARCCPARAQRCCGRPAAESIRRLATRTRTSLRVHGGRDATARKQAAARSGQPRRAARPRAAPVTPGARVPLCEGGCAQEARGLQAKVWGLVATRQVSSVAPAR
jgi:hypothetical protein